MYSIYHKSRSYKVKNELFQVDKLSFEFCLDHSTLVIYWALYLYIWGEHVLSFYWMYRKSTSSTFFTYFNSLLGILTEQCIEATNKSIRLITKLKKITMTLFPKLSSSHKNFSKSILPPFSDISPLTSIVFITEHQHPSKTNQQIRKPIYNK